MIVVRLPSEPKLLSRTDSSLADSTKKATPAFDIHKSNITSYSFLDEGKKVRLYIDLECVGDACDGNRTGICATNAEGGVAGADDHDDRTKAQVKLDWSETSMSLLVTDYPTVGDARCLSFGRLHGRITNCAVKTKKDRLVVTIMKAAVADDKGDAADAAKAGGGEEETKPSEPEYEEWLGIAAKGGPEHELV